MRKPIIVFSLVMMLAPLPTIIPWVYDTCRTKEITSWYAVPPGHFRTTGYAPTDDGAPWLMDNSAMNLDETVRGGIVWKEGWGCSRLRDNEMLLTKVFYH